MTMRIVTLEEHISFPELTKLLPAEALAVFGQSPAMQQILPKLADVTGDRLKSMDNNGISVQVLSVDSFGAGLLSREKAPAFATLYNDTIAQKIAAHPGRFRAFAHFAV